MKKSLHQQEKNKRSKSRLLRSKSPEGKQNNQDEREKKINFEKDPEEIRKQLYQMIRTSAAGKEEKKDSRDLYLYLYDAALKEKSYRVILANVESRLSDFEIMGKAARLSNFTNPRAIIEDEMRRGIKTVIIVGNDDTFAQVLTKAADLEVTFGFLPIGQKKNYLAHVLGLPLNEDACEVIAARKIEKIDYGVINQSRFFLSYLYAPAAWVKIACDGNFAINKMGKEKIELAVSNLLPPPFGDEKFVLHPQDGQMELYLRPQTQGMLSSLIKGRQQRKISVFPFKFLSLNSAKPMTVLADGKETQELSVEIEVAKKKLKMIVGKNREF